MSSTTVAVGKLRDLKSGTSRRLEIDGVAVAVVRIDDDVYAIGDVCSHANVSLSDGEVWCDELELECPKHGSAFSLLTGVPATLPATQPVAVYAASIVDGEVFVTVSDDNTVGDSHATGSGGPA